MGGNTAGQNLPVWEFRNDGKEIFQAINSSPGVAIGEAKLSAVDFEGTMYVGAGGDDDWIALPNNSKRFANRCWGIFQMKTK